MDAIDILESAKEQIPTHKRSITVANALIEEAMENIELSQFIQNELSISECARMFDYMAGLGSRGYGWERSATKETYRRYALQHAREFVRYRKQYTHTTWGRYS